MPADMPRDAVPSMAADGGRFQPAESVSPEAFPGNEESVAKNVLFPAERKNALVKAVEHETASGNDDDVAA